MDFGISGPQTVGESALWTAFIPIPTLAVPNIKPAIGNKYTSRRQFGSDTLVLDFIPTTSTPLEY